MWSFICDLKQMVKGEVHTVVLLLSGRQVSRGLSKFNSRLK